MSQVFGSVHRAPFCISLGKGAPGLPPATQSYHTAEARSPAGGLRAPPRTVPGEGKPDHGCNRHPPALDSTIAPAGTPRLLVPIGNGPSASSRECPALDEPRHSCDRDLAPGSLRYWLPLPTCLHLSLS